MLKMMVCDWIFISTILIASVFCAWAMIFGAKKAYNIGFSEKFRFFIIKRNAFLRSSIVWLAIYYWLHLGSILATITVIYLSVYNSANTKRIFVYSVISLFFIFAELVLQPKTVSLGYRKAYILIDTALNTYNDGDEETKRMADKLKECEEIIKSVHS